MPHQDESNPSNEEFSDLEWISLRSDVSNAGRMGGETSGERLSRKMKDNPFVPIGCLFTAGVLVMGLRSFAQGDRQRSQRMMRFRVIAQGTTIVALLAPMLYAASTGKK